jgi:hypothetical protein
MTTIKKHNKTEDLIMNKLKENKKNEEKNMDTIKNRNTYLLDVLGLTNYEFRTLWKEYYKKNRPFYKEISVYKNDGCKAMIKNNNFCPSCVDHLFHTLVLDKNPLEIFAASTVGLGHHKDFFSILKKEYQIKDISKRIFNIILNESQLNDIVSYLKLNLK